MIFVQPGNIVGVASGVSGDHAHFTSTIGDLIADYVSGKIPGSVKKENIELRKSTII